MMSSLEFSQDSELLFPGGRSLEAADKRELLQACLVRETVASLPGLPKQFFCFTTITITSGFPFLISKGSPHLWQGHSSSFLQEI